MELARIRDRNRDLQSQIFTRKTEGELREQADIELLFEMAVDNFQTAIQQIENRKNLSNSGNSNTNSYINKNNHRDICEFYLQLAHSLRDLASFRSRSKASINTKQLIYMKAGEHYAQAISIDPKSLDEVLEEVFFRPPNKGEWIPIWMHISFGNNVLIEKMKEYISQRTKKKGTPLPSSPSRSPLEKGNSSSKTNINAERITSIALGPGKTQ